MRAGGSVRKWATRNTTNHTGRNACATSSTWLHYIILIVARRATRSFFLTSVLFLSAAAHAEVRFNRDIRPIMAETCFRCHGPDKNSRMAGMRLDIREQALQPTASGAIPIVPGDPEK